MPGSPAPAAAIRPRHLRLVPTSVRLRVADVALFYGERSGGIRTYLDAKAAWARAGGAIDHHLVVPGAHELHRDGRHELRSLRLTRSNGYRVPFGVGALKEALSTIRPDVVLLHDPFWSPRETTRFCHALGATVIMVHHVSAGLEAGALRGPQEPYRRAVRAWLHRAYEPADAVMAACDPWADTGRPASVRLRFGLDPAFRPSPDVTRADHVLYVGRLAREKGVFTLLEAAARSRDPWPVRFVGSGTAGDPLAARARRLGLDLRVSFAPFVRDRRKLAGEYAAASCVVMPGEYETFGLAAFEAAASGASTASCTTAPATHALGALAEPFAPGDPDAMLAAIARGRARRPDRAAAGDFARRHSWARAFEAELADLEALVRPSRGRSRSRSAAVPSRSAP
jgi:alpha-1,6-mannosyltransferase